MSRRWLFRGIALLAAPFIALALVEGGARVLSAPAEAEIAFNAPMNAPSGMYVTDHDVAYIPTPGFSAISSSPGYRVQIDINSLGLRGPEVGEKRGKRWLVGGDSFTMAAQVDHDESFVGLLDGEDEFLNAGADGYGTWQALGRYKALDEELDLDGLIVVFFTGNDFADNDRFKVLRDQAKQREHGALLPEFGNPPLQQFLSRHSFLYARWTVSKRTQELMAGNNPERDRWASELLVFTARGAPNLQRSMKGTERAFDELARETRQRGDELLVAIAPPGFAVDPTRRDAAFGLVGLDPAEAQPRLPTETVLEALARRRIASCDLQEPLRLAIEEGQEPYFDFDGHWTPEGHVVVANTIASCLP